MFPEPPTPGSPAPETPPDSSRIRHGAGEKTQRQQKAGLDPKGRDSDAKSRVGGLENRAGIVGQYPRLESETLKKRDRSSRKTVSGSRVGHGMGITNGRMETETQGRAKLLLSKAIGVKQR